MSGCRQTKRRCDGWLVVLQPPTLATLPGTAMCVGLQKPHAAKRPRSAHKHISANVRTKATSKAYNIGLRTCAQRTPLYGVCAQCAQQVCAHKAHICAHVRICAHTFLHSYHQ
jgi:hypothetical protein